MNQCSLGCLDIMVNYLRAWSEGVEGNRRGYFHYNLGTTYNSILVKKKLNRKRSLYV